MAVGSQPVRKGKGFRMGKIKYPIWEKLLSTIRTLNRTAVHHYGPGFSSTLRFLVNSLFKVSVFRILSRDLNEEIPDLPLDAEFHVIKPTLEELDRLRSGRELPREFYYDQFHGVTKCYVALAGEEIAYIHWIYRKGDPNRFLNLGDGVAELNYNTTLPRFRRRGLAGQMLVFIMWDLQAEGYKKVVGVANKENIAQIKACEKAGWRITGTITAVGPFNRRIRIGS